MPHPLLECADVDAILQMPGRVCMAEFVKEPATAKGTFGTAINLDGAIDEPMRGSAVAAVQLAAEGDRLELFQHSAF